MRRITCILALSLAVTLAIAALCALPANAKETLRFNTVAGPLQPEYKGMEVFAKELERISGGRMKVRLYHSGQLGNQQTQITGVMRGTLDMAFSDANALAQFDPRMGIFGAAYLFRDLDHLYAVMEGPIGKEYFDRLAKEHGIRVLDVWYLGTRQLTLRNKPARTPDDMRGVRLRMPNTQQWLAMGRALGAEPAPMEFGEVYLALKTGVVDGQDNPLPTTMAQKFHEVTKYLVLTNHQIGMIWPSINERLWQRMSLEEQGWILAALRKARLEQNAMVIESEKRLKAEFNERFGIEIVEPDIDAFRVNARKVYREFEDRWGAGMYGKIQSSRDGK